MKVVHIERQRTSLLLTEFSLSLYGVQTTAVTQDVYIIFQQKLTKLANLFLADNRLEAVPQIPESVRIVHLQVCL